MVRMSPDWEAHVARVTAERARQHLAAWAVQEHADTDACPCGRLHDVGAGGCPRTDRGAC